MTSTMIRSLVIALCLLALAPASAQAAAGMELGLQDDAVFLDERWMDRELGLDRAQALGVDRIRVNVLWARTLVAGAGSRTAPARPVYDFSRIDALQAAAARRHIELQLTLAGPAPAWATADHRVGPDRPDAARFGAFARAVASHFAGRVDRYSIWNEPNWNTWLAPGRDAARIYRGLYRAGYAQIKAVDPGAKVLFGELAPIGGGRAIAPLRFLRAVTAGPGGLRADGFALHPYQFTSAPHVAAARRDDVTIGTLGRLTTTLGALARSHRLRTPAGRPLDLYLTEFGYLSQGSRALTPKVRAAYLKAAFRIARRTPRVRQLLQYQLVDPPENEAWHSAVLDRHGRPEPAYASLLRR
jgi:hypothetical protein